MLLITDRGTQADRVDRRRADAVARLDAPLVALPRADAIVCDVSLDDLATIQRLREALARYRRPPETPVHFILRDRDIGRHALANALGATTIAVEDVWGSAADASAMPVHEVPATLDRAGPDEDVATVAGCLARIFEAAARRMTVTALDLDQGVTALLRSIREIGVSRWVEVVRRYDDATYQHCLLVAGLTAAFSVRLGLSLAKQRMLVKASLLHDIGKAKVPVGILNKAGPLTAAEQALIRRHPSDGYYMLVRQGDLEPGVLDVVLHHHELLDGTGYPEGLRKDRISDVVRVVTICDIYAALIERRPYRGPMEARAAYEMLVAMGNKLDATLVEVFAALVEALRHPEGAAQLETSS